MSASKSPVAISWYSIHFGLAGRWSPSVERSARWRDTIRRESSLTRSLASSHSLAHPLPSLTRSPRSLNLRAHLLLLCCFVIHPTLNFFCLIVGSLITTRVSSTLVYDFVRLKINSDHNSG
jgi:hypothetical protein